MRGYEIIWKDSEIGFLTDVRPDMFYLEGIYHPNATILSKEFADVASKFDAREVMSDPTRGIRAKLQIKDEEPINVVVLSLGNKNELFVRQVFNEQSIDWLLQNIPEKK